MKKTYQMMVQDNYGLSKELIKAKCPAIFAADKHADCSDKFTFISTEAVLDAAKGWGFTPTLVMQAKPRIEDRINYARHLIRFRHDGDLGRGTPHMREVVMTNAHLNKGGNSYQIMEGVFRIICSNGLITGDIDKVFKVYHRGNILEQVARGTFQVMDESEQTMQDIELMRQIPLNPRLQKLMAEFALHLRLGIEEKDDDENVVKSTLATPPAALQHFQPQDFLHPRRYSDMGKTDLWTVFNTVQENTMKGITVNSPVDGKKHFTRRIDAIDKTVKLNRTLWAFAQRIKEEIA